MNVKGTFILTTLLILNYMVHAQVLGHLNLQQHLTMEGCDLMTVAYPEANTNTHSLVFKGGIISFQGFNHLLDVKDEVKFRFLMARMSCLVIIARLKCDTEILQLMDRVKEIKISKKYLTIFIENLDTTILPNMTINFNVIFNHGKQGEFEILTLNKFA